MKTFSKVLAVVLCLTMLCGMLPAAVFATDPEVIYQGASFGTNGYYNIISKNEWVLVPGAATETELVINNSTGTRRQVLHVIEVDPSNPDVSIVPGYYQIDKDLDNEANWSHKELTEMAKYYEEKLGYNIVGGMNTDLYYNSYSPRVLVYNGVSIGNFGENVATGGAVLNPTSSILYVFKDAEGNVSCDVKAFNKAQLEAYLEEGILLHAVGVSFGMVVSEGKLVNTTEKRGNDDAARSMVGIKEDGTLVICMNDGRGANNSVGFSTYEEGEAMLALGCKWAANCDGGGSSTFLTKRAGEEEFTMRSVPCDGAQRPTAHGIFVASNVAPTGILDVVNVTSDYDIFAPKTVYTFGTEAIDTHGYAMDMPAEATWSLSDASFGTIENGRFTSNGKEGDVAIQVVSGGKVVGSRTITVAVPEVFNLSATSTVVPYTTADKIRTITLPIVSMTGEANVYYDTNVVSVSLSNEAAGTLDGFEFTSTSDESISDVDVTIKYNDITLTYAIAFGKGSEVIWDFEDGDKAGFMGFEEAKQWSIDNGINNSLVGTNPLGGQMNSYLSSVTNAVTEKDGGQVRNGKYALAWKLDNTDANFANWAYNVLFNTEDAVVLRDVANGKKAVALGMWLYIPENAFCSAGKGPSFQSQFYTKNADGTYTHKQDHFMFTSAATGKLTNLNSATNADIPESRWVYASIDISKYDYLCTPVADNTSSERAPSFLRTYVKPDTAEEIIFYIDDITLDYSTAVDDRVLPTITSPTYSTSDTAVALNNGIAINGNKIAFSATVSDNAALDLTTGKIFVDGIEVKAAVSGTSLSSAEDVVLVAGAHTVAFEIKDELGNPAKLIRDFTVTGDTIVAISGHNDSGSAAKAQSIYYVDINVADLASVTKLVAQIKLNNANKWETKGAVVANGFEATFAYNEVSELLTVTVELVDASKVKALDKTLVSIPVRVWTFERYDYVSNVYIDPATMGNKPVVNVEAKVVCGEITVDKTTSSFGGAITVATELTTISSPYHFHDSELTILNKDATCTVNGYANRTYCETCASVVDWGTVIDATGHTYEFVDDVLKCTNGDCGAAFTGTWTDGKDYVDGVAVADGWNGDYYYENGVKYTGIKAVDGVYYNFGEDGKSQGKYTGLIDNNGVNYYAIAGSLVGGWQMVEDKYYYFDNTTFAGLNGEYSSYEVASTSQNFTYTFVNGLLKNGAWVKMDGGTRYYYGPTYYHNTTTEINGKTYSFRSNGYRYEGTCVIKYNPKGSYQLYEFTDDGVFVGELYVNGVYTISDGSIYYFNNGIPEIPGLVLGDDGYYYYFHNSYTAVKNGTYTVTNTNGYVKAGAYEFDANGRMIIKQGIVKDADGYVRYYVDNVATYAGLVKDTDGSYYYISGSTLTAVTNCSRYITFTNGLLPEGTYKFGPDGKMIIKQGIVQDADGEIRYYVDGVSTYAGLVKHTDGSYYYISGSTCTAVKDCTRYITFTNGLLPEGTYKFGPNGKMIIKQGIVKDADGKIRYYVDGVSVYAGLVKDTDGSYYYISGNGCVAVTNCTKYITFTNGLLPEGTYKFDADGKIILKQGVIKDADGEIRYYVDGTAVYAGLVQDSEGNYYYISGNGCVAVKNSTRYITFTNGLLPAGTYIFGADGKMIIE